MKSLSTSGKSKTGASTRPKKNRPSQGELFLGYKALHELRILLRIASAPQSSPTEPPDPAKSF